MRLILADTYSEMGCSSEAVALTRLAIDNVRVEFPSNFTGTGFLGSRCALFELVMNVMFLAAGMQQWDNLH